jgi:predicted DNA-binding protein (MmcQ/YjbR family)
MTTNELKVFCARFPGAAPQWHDAPANILVYHVDAKRFAYFKTSEPERWRFSVRVSPDRFLELTDVAGIKPARFFSRFHWVTIVDVRRVPEHYLVELVEWSYRKAVSGLGKRRQAVLLSGPVV